VAVVVPATDADVPAFWRSLRLPGLIDTHVHFMPDNVMAKVWAYFDRAGPLVGQEWPIAYKHAEDERLARLRSMGVRGFPSMIYPHKPGMAAWLNSWATDFARRTPDCLHTATFYPEPSAAAYVDEALAAGARVFKLHVQVGDYDPRDALLEPVWTRLAQTGTPVVVHGGNGPRPGRFTGPDILSQVLARHPGLVPIIAHMGMSDYAGFVALADRYPRLHLDTTMAFTDFAERSWPYPRALLPRIVELGERILLGTDFPNIPYPYAHQLAALARLDLGEDWLRAVCWGNAARLFGITAAGDGDAASG
jgi:uncharacterized protein